MRYRTVNFSICSHFNEIVTVIFLYNFLAGSIISKKVAEQPKALVLDVKFGIGAVIQDKDQSRDLAQKMV